ncbi:MAG: hypothetical protein MJ197_08790 [Bacteroidales bacterium]|nr:hypothetical protein [Bacteroidales bacterium]
MAELNDLLVRGDTLLQGNAKVGGTLNGTQTITDDDVLVIDVAKEINIDTTGVKLEIPIPSGYVGNPTAKGIDATVVIDTYCYSSIPAVTNSATVKVSSTNAITNTTHNKSNIIGVMGSQTFDLEPFCKNKITVEVTKAPTGATFKAIVYTKIYCRKQ